MSSLSQPQNRSLATGNFSVEELQNIADRIQAYLAATDPNHPDRAAILNEQCLAYYRKWRISGDPKDVAEAVKAGRDATHALSTNNTSRGAVFSTLSIAILGQFRYTQNGEDIDAAINFGERVLTCFERESPNWQKANHNLCEMMYTRGRYYRTAQSIDDAIEFMKKASEPGVISLSFESTRLAILASLMSLRFEATGSLKHLEQAISMGYESIEKLEKGSRLDQEYDSTSTALKAHFQVTGLVNSLDEALRISRLLLAELNDGRHNNVMQAHCLSTHGSILELKSQRYRETNPGLAMETLNEALEAGRRALDLLPSQAENESLLLSQISSWMGSMAKMSQNSKWIDDGIDLLQRALESNTGNVIDDSTLLANLSNLWVIKYNLLSSSGVDQKHLRVLNTAIELGKRALSGTENSSLYLGERRKNLASMLLTKHNIVEDPQMLPYIMEMFIKAAETETAPLLIRIMSALQVGLLHWENGDAKEANMVLQNAIGLLTSSNLQAASAEDLQQILREVPGLGSLAASVSLGLGRPLFEALQSLESANCVVSGLTMSSKTDVSELERQHPGLASTYRDIKSRVSQATRQLKVADNFRSARTLQQALLEEMAQTEETIRQLEGFEQFQLPLNADQIWRLASDGPIVVINASKLRSDAIIVTEAGIQSLHLPYMTHDSLQKHITVFSRMGNISRRNAVSIPIDSNDSDITPTNGLRWLWDVAVRPILDVIELTQSGRLWWITSGSAGRAPFHAAGNYDGDINESVTSRVVSSYISSLKALKYGRDRQSVSAAKQSMLLVTMSTNPAPHHHLNTRYEEEAIHAVFSKDKMLHLAHPDPQTVLKEIPRFSFAHFACHGASIDRDPNKSGLLLVKAGKPADLTISDLEELDLNEGFVAYLSACSTAEQTNGKLASEAIHLANSFQALGFQHVIGTMWGADDAAAGEVARKFYKKLAIFEGSVAESRQVGVAQALHEAVSEYRTSGDQANVLKWAPFVHVGV